MKIACATPLYPKDLEDGISQIRQLANEAANKGAEIICFPESFLPGYPVSTEQLTTCDPQQLEKALVATQEIARQYKIAIILPMDDYEQDKVYNVAYVIDKSGDILGYQTKNQLDPSEDLLWTPGTKREIFKIDQLRFGIVICHEGFRYPETVRWAAKEGAQIVFHPFYAGVDERGLLLSEWGQKDAPYYEKAQMVRALENTIFFATSNYAFTYPEAASSVIDPLGNCLDYQPYGTSGVLVVDIQLDKATRTLAKRFKPI